MSKIKYTEETKNKATELRLSGLSLPEITEKTGMKSVSLKTLFREKGIKLTPEQKTNALARRWLNHEPIVDGRKKCSKCGIYKPITEFHKNSNRISGLVSSCKECYSEFYEENSEIIKERTNRYRLSHFEKKKEDDRAYYHSHKQVYVDNAKKWVVNNPDKRRIIQTEYDKRTQKQKNARTARYRAAKLKATPPWLSAHQLEEMKRIYENCPKGFHVDHIVPLLGKNVRGLHVPWNLQYLPGKENLSKSNKF